MVLLYIHRRCAGQFIWWFVTCIAVALHFMQVFHGLRFDVAPCVFYLVLQTFFGPFTIQVGVCSLLGTCDSIAHLEW